MSTLLDAILGSFNGGQIGGYPPGDMLGNAPGSGTLPEVSTPPTDSFGNRVGGLAPGGLAPGAPLPRPRTPEAGPAAFSPDTPDAALPDPQPGESSGVLAAALGLNPDAMRRMSAGLAGGLSNVKNSPFAGQVAANAAGGAFAAGNKSDETAINQALKLRQIDLRGMRGNPVRATMPGQGTLAAPYVPANADHYAQIAPGAHYRHWDGSLRIKSQPDKDVTNGAG